MIRWPHTLRSRLTFGYTVAFFTGLLAFAAISYLALDTALREVVEAPLHRSEAAAAAILADDPTIDHATRERLALAIGSNQNGAVFSGAGKAVFSSVVSIAPQTRELVLHAGNTPELLTVRIAEITNRMITHRILTGDGSYAYIGVWHELDLVDALKRLAVVLFGGAAVVIGAAAVLVGSIVAREGLKPLGSVAALASEIEAHDLSRRLALESDGWNWGGCR